MPFAEHSLFMAPENPDATIWRFLDFPKFISLLENHSLFFCRADLLGDAHEGFLPYKNRELLRKHNKHWSKDDFDKFLKQTRENKYLIAVNSWHMNRTESYGMWNTYLRNSQGLAIKSTFSKLKESFKKRSLSQNLWVIVNRSAWKSLY